MLTAEAPHCSSTSILALVHQFLSRKELKPGVLIFPAQRIIYSENPSSLGSLILVLGYNGKEKSRPMDLLAIEIRTYLSQQHQLTAVKTIIFNTMIITTMNMVMKTITTIATIQ